MIRGEKKVFIVLFILIFSIISSNIIFAIENVGSTSNTASVGSTTGSGSSTTTSVSSTTESTETSRSTTNSNTNLNKKVVDTVDLDKAYNWLYNKSINNIGTDAEQGLELIALLGEGKNKDLQPLVARLKTNQDTIGCWPKGQCKVKDTALATLAMYLSGQTNEATAGANWLKGKDEKDNGARIAGLNTGDWLIEIKTTGTKGTCTVTYKERTKNFDIENDQIKQARGKYYINLLEVDATILRTSIKPEITVDCSNLPGSIITLLYKPNPNIYFIQNSLTTSNAQLKIANACYGETKSSGRCDYESTAWATLALLEIEGEINLADLGTSTYLETQVKLDSNDITSLKQLALLNRILFRASAVAPTFIETLAKETVQKPDGSWAEDVYTTGLAMFGLSGSEKSDAIARATNYLTRRQVDDGSWGNNLISTSMALIALHGPDLAKTSINQGSVPPLQNVIPGKNQRDCTNYQSLSDEGLGVCGDPRCEDAVKLLCTNGKKDYCEEDLDCGGQCKSCSTDGVKKPATSTNECTIDSDCSNSEECLSKKCVKKESDKDEGKSSTTPKEKKSLWWLWLLLILIILGGGLLFFYTKYVSTGKIDLRNLFKKKPKGPTFEEFRRVQEFKPLQRPIQRSQTRPITRPTMPIKSKEEDELEKSIREAQRLIKGK